MSGRKNVFVLLIAVLMLSSLAMAPAFGHHKEGHEGGPKDQDSTEQTEDSSTAESSDDEKPGKGPKDKDKAPKDKPAKGPKDKAPKDKPSKSRGPKDKGDTPYTDGAPGNNGTIKIDGEPYDTSKGQESHVGCNFRVLYWGTDEGEALDSTLTFVAHPPTGGPFTFVDTITLQAGEPDVAGPYNLLAGLQAAGIEPHAKQGWHIKLTTNTEYSQGADTKHKVFWYQCDETAPVVEEETEVAPCEDEMAEDDATCGEDEIAPAPGSDDTAVLGSEFEREGAAPPAEEDVAVAGESLERSSGILPFTGGNLGVFLLIGLGLVALGALFIRARRTS